MARKRPFRKILIANRGEIACRVIATAHRLGIKTVAVYSDADKNAPHVALANEAVCIGPAPSAESYLNADAIVAACKATKAEAVHPGYGFLSENAAFARKLARAGIVFIGPKPAAIKAMGDKISAKQLAVKAGVNVIPGSDGALKNVAAAVKAAKKIGYPVMLKASAGGGGKGMRLARTEKQLKEGFAAAAREAKSSFGDDRVFVEKFIENPRHIEIQVLADAHGNVVHLGERECSLQRRHQKVIEESPSPLLDDATRQAMGAQAVKLARAVKYVSAGTVEFVADAERNFYFLEMNTRLQVEHPVTECVTGLDLVEQMLRIAAGEKLTIKQEAVQQNGWAMEARLYAEDPARGFLPSVGRLVRFRPPEEVRVDTGVEEGGEISRHYDPMIAKVIAHGPDRDTARDQLQSALAAFVVEGVQTNTAFLSRLVGHDRFRAGDVTTDFIDQTWPQGYDAQMEIHADPHVLAAVGCVVHAAYQARAAQISGQTAGFERQVRRDWAVLVGDARYDVSWRDRNGDHLVEFSDGRAVSVASDWRLSEPLFLAQVEGQDVCVQIARDDIAYRLTLDGVRQSVRVLRPPTAGLFTHMPEKVAPDLSAFLLSPLPGLLTQLSVRPGDKVHPGDALCVVEAMKMENVLRAERAATISQIKAQVGETLAVDQVILTFEDL